MLIHIVFKQFILAQALSHFVINWISLAQPWLSLVDMDLGYLASSFSTMCLCRDNAVCDSSCVLDICGAKGAGSTGSNLPAFGNSQSHLDLARNVFGFPTQTRRLCILMSEGGAWWWVMGGALSHLTRNTRREQIFFLFWKKSKNTKYKILCGDVQSFFDCSMKSHKKNSHSCYAWKE